MTSRLAGRGPANPVRPEMTWRGYKMKYDVNPPVDLLEGFAASCGLKE